MSVFISPELASAHVGAQGVAATSESAASDAKFATQLLGRPFDEATLLALGHPYQGATDFHKRAPAL